jgi:hypothetical protein
VEAGAVHETNDRPSAAPTATTAVGASGTADGTIEEEASDDEPAPDALVAVTLNV